MEFLVSIMRVLAAGLLVATLLVPALAQSFEDGQAAAQEGDPARAIAIWRPLAEAGHAEAQYWLAESHWGGWWGVLEDMASVAEWHMRAADQGHVPSFVALGGMYQNGWHFAQDDEVAAAWFLRAAEAGDAEGQYSLAYAYFFGLGVPRNQDEARRLWRLSYAHGHEGAGDALCAELAEACPD